MKKKILSIFLAAAMTFGLTACGSSGDTTAAPESAEPAVTEASSASGETPEADAGEEKEPFEGTITIACGPPESEALQKILKLYQEKNPNVDLDIIITQTVTDFETMMTGWIAADTLPDMYIAQVGSVEQGYAANGYLEPLTDPELLDRLVEGDRELISYNGDVYAFPMNMSVSAILVNNGVLKEAGIDLNHDNYPKCWQDLMDLFQKGVDAGIEKPIGLAGQDSSAVTAWTFQYIYQTIYGENPNWYADILRGKAAWNDDLYMEMFNKYSEMLPFIADDALGTASDGMRKKFITGESPIYFQVAGEVGILKELDPDLDILLLPSAFTDKPEDQTIISGFDSGISITKSAKNKDLCMDFLDFITSSEGATILTTTATYLPTTKDNQMELDPAFDLIYNILKNDELPNSPILSRQWIPGVKEIMKTGQQNWFAGEDAKSVADKIQEEHTRLMEADPEWVENFLANYQDK